MSWLGPKRSKRRDRHGRDVSRNGAGHRDDEREELGRGDRHDGAEQSQFGWGRAGHESGQGSATFADIIRSDSNNPAQSRWAASKFVIVAAMAVLVLWSLVAWGAYGLVDMLGDWLTANGGTLLQGGKDAAGAVGIGKEIIDRVDIEGTTGLLQQLIAAALMVARPTIVFVWFLGAVAIAAAPFVVKRLGRLVRSRR